MFDLFDTKSNPVPTNQSVNKPKPDTQSAMNVKFHISLIESFTVLNVYCDRNPIQCGTVWANRSISAWITCHRTAKEPKQRLTTFQ